MPTDQRSVRTFTPSTNTRTATTPLFLRDVLSLFRDGERNSNVWCGAQIAVILDRKTPAARAPNRQTLLLEEAETLGHASETWSVATALYRVREGRKVEIARTGSFPIFRMKPVFREMPLARPADLDTLSSPHAQSSSSRRATSLWPKKSCQT